VSSVVSAGFRNTHCQGELVTEFIAHRDAIQDIKTTEKKNFFITASLDKTAKVWVCLSLRASLISLICQCVTRFIFILLVWRWPMQNKISRPYWSCKYCRAASNRRPRHFRIWRYWSSSMAVQLGEYEYWSWRSGACHQSTNLENWKPRVYCFKVQIYSKCILTYFSALPSVKTSAYLLLGLTEKLKSMTSRPLSQSLTCVVMNVPLTTVPLTLHNPISLLLLAKMAPSASG